MRTGLGHQIIKHHHHHHHHQHGIQHCSCKCNCRLVKRSDHSLSYKIPNTSTLVFRPPSLVHYWLVHDSRAYRHRVEYETDSEKIRRVLKWAGRPLNPPAKPWPESPDRPSILILSSSAWIGGAITANRKKWSGPTINGIGDCGF